MSLDFDVLLGKLGVKEPGVAMYHIYSGLVWSLLWAHFCRLSPWFFFSALFWIGLILFRELWVERHQTASKTRSDIITKLVGLVGYGMAFIK
jgi:hypothetical protein